MSGELLPVALLAGGLATRLRPITNNLPKALIDVAGQPFIAHQLRLLRRCGVSCVVICAGYRGEMIESHVGNGAAFDLEVTYSFDSPQLLGTAGALRRAAALLGSDFFVLYGDSYLECDYAVVQRAFQCAAKPALVTVFRNQGKYDRSNVEYVDGEVRAYSKACPTPHMQHIDYGLGVLTRACLDLVPSAQPYDLARLYEDLLARGQLAGLEVRERFYEVGSFAGLEETRRHVATSSPGSPGGSNGL